MEIGDFAMYGSCRVQISSVKLRGIGAPHYRFFCVEDDDHHHHNEWGSLTSYRLLMQGRAVVTSPGAGTYLVQLDNLKYGQTHASQAVVVHEFPNQHWECQDCGPQRGTRRDCTHVELAKSLKFNEKS